MSYHTETPDNQFGYAGIRRKFGDDAEWFEYRDRNYLVMVGDTSCRGKPSLNIRIDHPSEFTDDGYTLKSPTECGYTFDPFWLAYLQACELWGYIPSDEARARRFFDQTHGYGVLWSRSKKEMTPNAARERIVSLVKNDNGPAALIKTIMTWANCHEADISYLGDIWIANPQQGHWLSDDHLIEFANWLAKQ